MTNYPVGDFLIQIKNTASTGKREVETKSSKLTLSVAKVMVNMGLLEKAEVKEGKIYIVLAYHKKEPVLMDLRIVSRPGLRRYMGIDELKSRKHSHSTVLIMSTPLGIISSKEAIKKKVGGEVLAEIW